MACQQHPHCAQELPGAGGPPPLQPPQQSQRDSRPSTNRHPPQAAFSQNHPAPGAQGQPQLRTPALQLAGVGGEFPQQPGQLEGCPARPGQQVGRTLRGPLQRGVGGAGQGPQRVHQPFRGELGEGL